MKRGKTIQNAVKTRVELGAPLIGRQRGLLKDVVPVNNVGTTMRGVPQKFNGIGASKVVPRLLLLMMPTP